MRKLHQPWLMGLVATLILLLSWFFQLNPLRDAVTMLPVADDITLHIGWSYIVFAPFFNLLDTLSFLSESQHRAVMLTLLLAPSVISALLWRKQQSWLTCIVFSLKICVFSLVTLLLLYATAVLMPRPMVALQVTQPDAVVVDLHSHTNYSWDANSWFTAEKNRLWHEKSGFDAAFITDHKSFKGAEEGMQHNPNIAKDGVLLLMGIEAAYHDTAHVMALCATRLNAKEASFNWAPLAVQSKCEPLLVQATPGPVQDLAKTHAAGQGVLAIEIHDAAPTGLEEIRHRQALIEKAKQLDIAVVYGSDNHGWAFASSGWSLLLIADWQTMHAEQLALAITDKMRADGFAAVQVIERNMLPSATSFLAHITMPVQLAWRMLLTISDVERLSWLAWAWLIVVLLLRKQRQ